MCALRSTRAQDSVTKEMALNGPCSDDLAAWRDHARNASSSSDAARVDPDCSPTMADENAFHNATKCFLPTLALLARHGCMRRVDMWNGMNALLSKWRGSRTSSELAPVAHLLFENGTRLRSRWRNISGHNRVPAIYVLVVPWLIARRARIEAQLEHAGAGDVTFVECANGPELMCLSAQQMQCLHPTYLRHPWTHVEKGRMPLGVLSLVVKHKLAVLDATRRNLQAAVVLEDDVTLRPMVWAWVPLIPADADVFYLGSYGHWTPTWRYSGYPAIMPGSDVLVRQWVPAVRNGSRKAQGRMKNVHSPVALVGSAAYIVFRKAFIEFLVPATHEADVMLSWFPASAPRVQYSAAYKRWLAWQTSALQDPKLHADEHAIKSHAMPSGVTRCGTQTRNRSL